MNELDIIRDRLRAKLEKAEYDYKKTWKTEDVFFELKGQCSKFLDEAYQAGKQAAFEEVRKLLLGGQDNESQSK
ncbi:MAG TPA: hypothetical protein K8V00_02950 [Ligilactobacillus acidipiscis]|uniref:Uncharacterized protein n=1 Tax=Ligilactobacillus acidipiscis TaxID=89059 RepID=A0A921F7C4_9LACO|nr:hypothetical protein [Ligilactobacillus acidipiscis]